MLCGKRSSPFSAATTRAVCNKAGSRKRKPRAFGSSPRAFGTPGAGGSLGFADPDAHLGYGYVMNKLDFWLVDDPREKALREAIYRAIRRVGARTGEHVTKRQTADIM